jgi:hypothetical protein
MATIVRGWKKGIDYDYQIGGNGRIAILATGGDDEQRFARVVNSRGDCSGSFQCAMEMMELNCGEFQLNEADFEFLSSKQDEVDAWETAAPSSWDD